MRIIDVNQFRVPFGGQTTEYLAHNLDQTADTKYYGFVDYRGSWVMQQMVTSTGVIRYCVGKQNYETNWANRASLTYAVLNTAITG